MQIIKRLGRGGCRVSASEGKEISIHLSLQGQGDITYFFSEQNHFYLKIKRSVFSKAKGDKQSSKELLRVPGIGGRNMQKLLDKGITDIAHLKHLYRHKVFVQAVHKAKWMNEMELSIYDSWFDPVVSVLPGLVPDGFIYLRASPVTCHRRLQLRKRAEENSVTLDYLQGLHEKHENWLFPAQCTKSGVLSMNQLPHDIYSMMHPDIRNRVFLLQGEHVHASIQKVPALILDCEPNIDFSRDVEAKQEYACQVAEFFEFVKRRKEIQTQDKDQHTRYLEKVIVPKKSSILGPDGNFLRSARLNSLQPC